jgi:hypothetical protein
MRVTYDWEFLEDGERIYPISIGMVAEDGREYYAICQEMPLGPISQSPWLMKNVIPSLPVRTGHSDPWDREHPDFIHVKPREQIRQEVLRFIMETPSPSLWAWFSAYDHVALAQLFGRMVDMPIGVPQRTNDIAQEWERLGYPVLPEQTIGNHNALQDARFNIVRILWLDQIAKGEKE